MIAPLPSVPRSFAPTEDADSSTVHIRGKHPTTVFSKCTHLVRDVSLAVVFAIGVGLCPDDDGETGPVLGLIREGPSLRHVVPVALVVTFVAALAAYGSWKNRPSSTDGTSHWVLTALALTIDERRLPWHELDEVRDRQGVLHVRLRGGQALSVPAHGHSKADRDQLVDRLGHHIREAADDDTQRDALHAAAEQFKRRPV